MGSFAAFGGDGGPHSARISDGHAWHRLRGWEFVLGICITAVALAIPLLDVHERPLPRVAISLDGTHVFYVHDPSVDHANIQETISTPLVIFISYSIPIVVHAVMQWRHPLPHATRDFVLSLLVATALEHLVTNVIKIHAGRFRPNFYAMCAWDTSVTDWDGTMNLCRSARGEKEGRQSFPSGHASCAFSTFGLLSVCHTFFVLCTPHCTTRPLHMHQLHRTLHLYVACLPLLLAAWIAVTRFQDMWHFPSDILAGAGIGLLTAWVAYRHHFHHLTKDEVVYNQVAIDDDTNSTEISTLA
ncbi:Aste57867_5854 [Aphanomyces stellatus]|uniref:Aste57867_5854 protein n=1 Tax=Aphanomyces stellatus TaxID=120398 RepID=A0A485KF43_9STRA|nr:hypothetical protein As57867_005840 [Aphanomyces stellatus]VFT82877.1 Aste57867_5854 [Aphanomyces stellatus]